MRLLFHSCCGPCVSGCLEILRTENISPELFWYNPNIHPYTEYSSRRDSLAQLSAAENLELIMIDDYGLNDFIRGIGTHLEDGPKTEEALRCLYCYRIRLEKTAAHAAENGYDAFSTSLLVSPYQRHDVIRNMGGELAEQHKVAFLYRDFREHFREGQNKARDRGLYMQKYCGCIFSADERTKRGSSKITC